MEEATEQDFVDYLEGLPPKIRKYMEYDGLEKCRTHYPFTRFVMERRDLGMDEWMQQHLSEEEFQWYKEQPNLLK